MCSGTTAARWSVLSCIGVNAPCLTHSLTRSPDQHNSRTGVSPVNDEHTEFKSPDVGSDEESPDAGTESAKFRVPRFAHVIFAAAILLTLLPAIALAQRTSQPSQPTIEQTTVDYNSDGIQDTVITVKRRTAEGLRRIVRVYSGVDSSLLLAIDDLVKPDTDLDNNGVTDADDLGLLLTTLGPADQAPASYDLNADGVINMADTKIILDHLGEPGPNGPTAAISCFGGNPDRCDCTPDSCDDGGGGPDGLGLGGNGGGPTDGGGCTTCGPTGCTASITGPDFVPTGLSASFLAMRDTSTGPVGASATWTIVSGRGFLDPSTPPDNMLPTGSSLTLLTDPTNPPTGSTPATVTIMAVVTSGSATCAASFTFTIPTIEFIDTAPTYAGDSPMSADSDNYFLRQDGDWLNLDIDYRILPADLPVTDVKIRIIEGETGALVTFPMFPPPDNDFLPGKKTGANFDAGDNLHIVWADAQEDGVFRSNGFYKIKLEVTYDFDPDGSGSAPAVDHIEQTPTTDGDPDTPGWQCPERGLAIHDLVYKHRPVMKFDSDEISLPADISFMMQRARIRQWQLTGDLLDPTGITWKNIVIAASPWTLNDLGANGIAALGDQQFFLDLANDTDRTAPPPWDKRVYHKSFTSDSHVFVQYWFFYPTSFTPELGLLLDFSRFRHEGDWEMVQFTVRLQDVDDPTTEDIDESTKPFWLAPFSATASQHFYGQTLKWKQEFGDNPPTVQDQDYIEKNGAFQPVLYVASRTHATYFRSGEFRTHLGTGNTGDQYIIPVVISNTDRSNGSGSSLDLTNSELVGLSHPPIINFWGGHWGEDPGPLADLSTLWVVGPPSPAFRGTIQSNPTGFHNAYLKSTQPQISIP